MIENGQYFKLISKLRGVSFILFIDYYAQTIAKHETIKSKCRSTNKYTISFET